MQINVTYDQSSLPAGFVAAVNYVINYFDTTFTNSITVNIDLGYGEIAGQSLGSGALGESETYFDSVGYSQAVNALRSNQPSAAQQSAYSTVPGSSPMSGGTLWVSTAEEKALGLLAGNNSAIDGYVGVSSTYPFSYSAGATPASGQYYFEGVLAHEFSEVLGRSSMLGAGLGGTNSYTVMDLFRYSAPGARQLGTGGPAYFSINNGTTNLDSWNTNSSGDLGDWAGSAGADSFLAFSSSGQIDWITQPDLTLLNVLGWDTTSAPAQPPPVVTANNRSVAAGQQVALSSLFSVSGSGITQYKVWFSYPEGGSPAVGTLTNNGTPIAPDQWVTLSSLSGWVYTGSAAPGTDKIWLIASNGQFGEAVASVTDPGTPAPVVTANNQSVAPGQQVALSSLFSVSSSGITQYKVWFSYPEGGSPAVGTLTNNGTPIAPDQYVTLSSLNGWVYTGSAVPGTDKIWLIASNGQSGEAVASVTDPGTPAPVVTANNQSVAPGQQVALSSLFSVSGSGITQYKVWFSYPEGGSPAVGTLTNNGTPIAPDQYVTLSSLNGWVYTGSASPGTDKIWLIASNGQSGEAVASITDPGTVGAAGVAAPVVTANNQSVTAGQQVALSSLFSVSGSGITQYKVWFSYPEGGSPAVGTLTNNGTPIAPDQYVTLSSLNGWVYTGSTSPGTDKIWLIASNGQSGEAVASIADPGMPAPVVTANSQSVAAGQQVALSSLFSVNGSGITQYKVWFSYPEGGSPAVGTLTNAGKPIAPDQWVTLSSLSGWLYTGSASPGTDRIWLIASNGQSGEAFADITDPGAGSTGHSPAVQLSGLGNAQGKLDQAVTLLSQYMAAHSGQSDFGTTNHLNLAFQDQSAFLAPPSQDHLHPPAAMSVLLS